MWVLNDTWNSAYDEKDVSDQGDEDGPDDGGVSAQVGIRDIGSEEWDDIDPCSPKFQ